MQSKININNILGIDSSIEFKPLFNDKEYKEFYDSFVADVAPLQEEWRRKRILSEYESMFRIVV